MKKKLQKSQSHKEFQREIRAIYAAAKADIERRIAERFGK